ncbi:MAG: PilW family protein [Pseudomonadales bacterium]|jgi:type IV pilus assembly protein PilW|nr:PilW family protein [Pseudomonadales bacterium]
MPRGTTIMGTRGAAAHRQRGLSLIELLVALALGAFITIGIIQMFTANQETYRVNIGQARMQEGARFAMEFLTAPIRMAGFMGCYSEPVGFFEKLNANASADYLIDFASPVDGHEATAPGVWSPDLAVLPADIPTASIVSGTDVLTIRTTDPRGTRLSAAMANPNAVVSVRTLPDGETPQYTAQDLFVISDCEKATFFQLTSATTTATTINMAHIAGGAAATPGNAIADITPDNDVYGLDATVHRVETQIFYIAPGAGGGPSLWRKSGYLAAPVELVEGIEDLQVLYGIDTDADGVPNRYRTVQNVGDLADVRTLRISITANSVNPVNDVGDGLLRRTFTNTIALRNRIGD